MEEARAKSGIIGVHYGQCVEFEDVVLDDMHNDDTVCQGDQALCTSRGERPGKYEVLLDNHSTCDMLVKESLLSNIRESDEISLIYLLRASC